MRTIGCTCECRFIFFSCSKQKVLQKHVYTVDTKHSVYLKQIFVQLCNFLYYFQFYIPSLFFCQLTFKRKTHCSGSVHISCDQPTDGSENSALTRVKELIFVSRDRFIYLFFSANSQLTVRYNLNKSNTGSQPWFIICKLDHRGSIYNCMRPYFEFMDTFTLSVHFSSTVQANFIG